MSIFREVHLFSTLSDDAHDWIAERAQTRQYPRGTIVIAEGQSGDELFVIESGSVKVYVSNTDGRDLVLYHAGIGDYVGELSIIDKEPRSATVKTLEKTTFAIINTADFRELLRLNPDFSLPIIETLTQKLRIATRRVSSLGLDPVYRRLIDLLNTESNMDKDIGTKVVRKLSHRQIADRIGSSREMVSKLMRDLEQGDYILSDGDRIVIKNHLPDRW